MSDAKEFCERFIYAREPLEPYLDLDEMQREAKGKFSEEQLIEAVTDFFEEPDKEVPFVLFTFDLKNGFPYADAIHQKWETREDWKPVFDAHKRSFRNKEGIGESSRCGCFYCLSIFPAEDIEEWVRKDDTALCPRCSIDSVIGDSSEYPITRDFLQKMKWVWFGHSLLGQKGRNWKK